MTGISNPANSRMTCRQAPQGAPALRVTTAKARIFRLPSEIALLIATLSAQSPEG